MNRKARHQALRQLLGLVLIIAVAVASAVIAMQRPADASKLRSETTTVRSQAHEALLLLDEEPDVWRHLMQAYARQLARRAQDDEQALAKMHVEPELERASKDARELATTTRRAIADIASGREDGTTLRAAAERLDRLDESLHH